jgi:hypothetical protein
LWKKSIMPYWNFFKTTMANTSMSIYRNICYKYKQEHYCVSNWFSEVSAFDPVILKVKFFGNCFLYIKCRILLLKTHQELETVKSVLCNTHFFLKQKYFIHKNHRQLRKCPITAKYFFVISYYVKNHTIKPAF